MSVTIHCERFDFLLEASIIPNKLHYREMLNTAWFRGDRHRIEWVGPI
jgi:hypothetical protein